MSNFTSLSVNGSPVWTMYNLRPASITRDGLLTKGDKSKLDGIQAGAQVNRAITDSVTTTSSSIDASATAVKTANDRAITAESSAKSYADSLLLAALNGKTHNSFINILGVGGTRDVNLLTAVTGLYTGSTVNWTNKGPSGNNAGALLSINTHSGSYDSQLWFDTDRSDIYTRSNRAGTLTPWAKLWHDANDGTGSGLDADLLDGLNSTSFVRTDAASTMTQPLTINWNTTGDILSLMSTDKDTSIFIGDTSGNQSYRIRYLGTGVGADNKLQIVGFTNPSTPIIIMDTTVTGTVNFPVTLQMGGKTVSTTDHHHNAAYLGINAKAVDSDKLDNLDSTQFLRSDTNTVCTGSIKSNTMLQVNAWSFEQDPVDGSLNFIFNS